jgi:hypothetical protein
MYRVKDVLPNRKYEWFVEGGTILSDRFSEEVEIQWGGIGTKGEIWYEEFSEINASCGGEALKLSIEVNPPLTASINSITDLICPGSSEGMILVVAEGGSGDYNFQWSHDPNLKTDKAENLSAGVYEVRVQDASGCEVFFDQLEIKESEPLELTGEIDIVNAQCWESADGQVGFSVSGGVPPYQVNWENSLIVNSDFQLFGLERGEYTLKVNDAAGCEIEVDFVIESPDEIQVEFITEKLACSGLSNGILTVVPAGGVGPYNIVWEWDESTSPKLMDIPSGLYGVSITDLNSCQLTAYGELKEGVPQLRMPTGFLPKEGPFQGVSNCDVEFKLVIYNKWGQMIFVGSQGWDGKIEGEDAPMGTYSYMIEYSFILEGNLQSRQQRGIFTLFN